MFFFADEGLQPLQERVRLPNSLTGKDHRERPMHFTSHQDEIEFPHFHRHVDQSWLSLDGFVSPRTATSRVCSCSGQTLTRKWSKVALMVRKLWKDLYALVPTK